MGKGYRLRPPGNSRKRSSDDFRGLDHEILTFAYSGEPRVDFLKKAGNLILKFSRLQSVELWFKENDQYYRHVSSIKAEPIFKYEIVQFADAGKDGKRFDSKEFSISGMLSRDLILGRREERLRDYAVGELVIINDIADFLSSFPEYSSLGRSDSDRAGEIGFLAIFPLKFCGEKVGLLSLTGDKRDSIESEELESYQNLANTLGIALMTQRAQAALKERVKELTCLYSIARVAEKEGISIDGILREISGLLPPAWQYPEAAAGRIILDGEVYLSTGFLETSWKQTSAIIVGGVVRGAVEVVYVEQKPDLDEGPFLREERSLIDAIAREVAMIVERIEAEEEKAKLQDQLRHADRLATIGQLAAGVAHEINEPLGSMLGFAQLARKHPNLPDQVEKDLGKIEAASLHAREIVKKLMLFGRQMPPQKSRINLNKMIEDGLYFIKSRCRKSGIAIELELAQNLPEITADQSQIYQVLVNLAVNAVQAMPDGGRLTIGTRSGDNTVLLIVEDTGVGMNEETQKKIFLPFFTTKEINEGTGIGLSVVHGIVISHGGTINVESEIGRGTLFEIRLPISAPAGGQKRENNDDTKSR